MAVKDKKTSATILDVARQAGVSPSSVSNYLNGNHARLGLKTRQRIQTVIDELRYRPNNAARQLKIGHSPIIGLLVPTVANPFFGELAVEVEQAAQAHGYRVLLCNTLRDRQREREFAEELITFGVRGLITASALSDPELVKILQRTRVAMVALDVTLAEIQSERVDVVTIDNMAATRMAVDHLVSLGHRQIAYVNAPNQTLSRSARLEGFREAIRRHGLADDTVITVDLSDGTAAFGDTSMQAIGRKAAAEVLKLERRPTAIVALNDITALGLIAEFREAGLNLPQDISIVGIDDINMASLAYPALTTIRQPFDKIASAAVELVDRRFEGEEGPAVEEIIVPKLVCRQSSAPPGK
ncbi:LacI family DNA-binding transcriptional regulator [Pseudohoeflea coraliihabitans]|uniref:LacI family transcriptional regulator n=1 Tax=Pseudohoeflea coraliihabitans TaxID=2860393 RepID=A0ABS6WMN0_9HYPH|nr:LacI family DNA-binding transcriptional regulator [Pseudohoeflea sp. DP4N28-3]MBW3097208.1 LacI family transcriptional regulator [Pseudohoeflea sp. DP4N28-3]